MEEQKSPDTTSKKKGLTLRDTDFMSMMQRRIFNVLIVANPYDAFMLEDDGRIDEKLFNEYVRLGLRYPPRFFRAYSREDVEKWIDKQPDLIICLPSTESNDVFDIARDIKASYPKLPIVVLTPFSHGVNERMKNEDLSAFEYVFCWLGNADLLLSIIKLIEDKMNLEKDLSAGAQMILLVEDSVRFYSSFLPMLYKFILQQSLNFASEALNNTLETLRMRGRPKIVLTHNYHEAWELYQKYSDNTLGIISDCRFPMSDGEEPVPDAGVKLLRAIRAIDRFVPLIMDSSEESNVKAAISCDASFINKNSKSLDHDLRKIILHKFGFGDFIFRNSVTLEPLVRIHNLKELQDNIFTLPREALLLHIRRNNVSRWLGSRALFPIAEFLKKITWQSLQDVDKHRQIIYDAIVAYRRMKNQGVVAVFHRERFDHFSNFARIGDGSLGGKGRGLAFLDHIIKKHADLNSFEQLPVRIPKTVVLCTDVFDEFMEKNDLYPMALSNASDEEILSTFIKAHLPQRLEEDFRCLVEVVQSPLAIRSSSLLEDAHYQPFAGIYSTYMIPPTVNTEERLEMLADAIKAVYASVFYKDSKAYMTATSNVIDQEKMAVIIQELVGQAHDMRFYPHISGVARSINYYPVEDQKAEDGIVNMALGLGKYIVDGGENLRVDPYQPKKIMQLSEMEIALRETQTRFLALDMSQTKLNFKTDDGFNLLNLSVRQADKDGVLKWLCSTFDPYDQIIRDGYYEGKNRKVISFSGILQYNVLPLAQVLQKILEYGSKEMMRPVEIEFACTVNDDKTGEFYLLQIRPMVDNKLMLDEDLDSVADTELILRSESAIGHGIMSDIYDIIYVKTDDYSASMNPEIAEEMEKINDKMLAEGRGYILVGPGRWGSSDPWLGVPVKWPAISGARVIVECGLTDYRIDPSQGTHFFQNLTSLGVAYFTINPYKGDGLFNKEWLDSIQAQNETKHIRHIRLTNPLIAKVDGMKKKGIVLKGPC
ncbi:MAG: PEP/pyruvate-binding domain-containing protein [Bacteroidales bacterium]|nr:PEP/pyruvate-binding domain-containing protein [Bacteroidales bacterium]MCM1147408.1 PEP/pyruvate-binding domain-containing protein [Bacteroidales bacterium]MCM1206077.1 PEP/pyruvate-binding domain-containing protein [Bacillota bacterium]MCM1510092.1 PEP/pyruvate-binding domain-containing protein [Clostridium sp.]